MKTKLIDLLNELKCFIFGTTLLLEFKKIENDDKKNIAPFIRN